jgi:hypothetical protein
MPPRIIAVLARLRQDLAACLSPEAIRQACRDHGHRWRERRLGPVATVSLFLLPILHGDTACQHVVHFARWTASASAFCRARQRLPLGVLQGLLQRVAGSVRTTTADAARWFGHRVWVVDGSSFSMPDVPALQAAFGQPAARAARLWLPRGAVAGPLRRGYRHAAAFGGVPVAVPRDGRLPVDRRGSGTGRCCAGGSGFLLVRPPGVAGRTRPPRGLPSSSEADRRFRTRSPPGDAGRALGEGRRSFPTRDGCWPTARSTKLWPGPSRRRGRRG